MIETTYLIPTRRCNLSCSHCQIKNNDIIDNYRSFLDKFDDLECDNCILFGGEPLTVKYDVLEKILNSGKVKTVSSNLLLLNDAIVNLLKKNDISVASSWNPDRFTSEMYNKWLLNIKKLVENKIYVTILITLTQNLIKSDIESVLFDLSDIKNEYFKGIRFEPYVQSDEKMIEESDNFLVKLYLNNNFTFRNILVEDYKNGNIHNCSGIYTLDQTGKLIHSCPHEIKDNILKECFSCKYSKVCKPCKKQKVCTFFKKLYEVVNHGRN